MARRKASDLFLATGKAARMRVLGEVVEVGEEALCEEDVREFLAGQFPEHVAADLERERDLDIGLSLGEDTRFRLNLFFQRGRFGMAARRVPLGNLSFAELRIPPVVRRLAESPRGLVLITGATGVGKSTTMAAMLHHINANFAKHIVTIEDPIEFLHRDLQSMVSQREVGSDTLSFAQALKHVVRQNPDVVFIGEMRDLETMETAISAAMTGHLVVSTMHTVDVTRTLERILNYFPAHFRDQAAQDLSHALAGIVSQRLVPRADGSDRVAVFETLAATSLARKLIRERSLDELQDAMRDGDNEEMCTFSQALVALYREGTISAEAGAAAATNKEEFLLRAEGMETGVATLRGADATADRRDLTMNRLLYSAIRQGASDLILTTGSAPLLRCAGELRGFDVPPLVGADTRQLLFSILSPSQRAQFEAEKEIDFALTTTTEGKEGASTNRFRVNGFYQKGCVGAALRLIPKAIPDPDTLRIPPAVMRLAERRQGLVLVTGPTGHGKSTTLACLIDHINDTRSCHVVTVEDPVEFVHTNRRAVIEQREVHADTKSFANALKYVLRQDPDVILIGEMRDPETIAAALTAAETGHLVFATLHTNDAPQTVDRIIDIFPGDRQNQIRTQLASCLEAVISQRLLPRDGSQDERVAAFEVMLGTTAVRSQIRDCRTHQLHSAIETAAKDGMVTLDRALLNLYKQKLISRRTVMALARDPGLV